MSSSNHNPYQVWLGIASERPSPRELLKLPPGEANPDLIRQAARAVRAKLAAIPQDQAPLRQRLQAEIDRAETELMAKPAAPGQVNRQVAQRDDVDLMAPFVPSMATAGTTQTPAPAPSSSTPPSPPAVPVAEPPKSAPPADEAGRSDALLPERLVRSSPSASQQARRNELRRRSAMRAVVGITLLTVVAIGAGLFAYRQGYFSSQSLSSASADATEPQQTDAGSQAGKKAIGDSATGDQDASVDVRPTPTRVPNGPTPGPRDDSPAKPLSPSDDRLGPSSQPGDKMEPPPKKPPVEKRPPVKSKAPSQPAFSVEQWRRFGRQYGLARQALSAGDFSAVQKEIAALRTMKPPAEGLAPLERLELVAAYAKQFRNRFLQGLSQLESGSELSVMTKNGERICAVVEASEQMLIVKVDGRIQRIAVGHMPAAMALAIAHRVLDVNDPVTKVVDAAYLAAREQPTDREIERAKQWWREARMSGVDIGSLEQFFDDERQLKARGGE